MPSSRFPRSLTTLTTVLAVLIPVSLSGQDKPKKERDLIAREELVDADTKMPDLLQAVSRLRPHFLTQNRGPRTLGIQPGRAGAPMCNETLERNCAAREGGNVVSKPVVYLDGTKAGDPDVLRGIRTKDVDEVKYLSANAAGAEYGLGHEGGVILVKLHRFTKP